MLTFYKFNVNLFFFDELCRIINQCLQKEKDQFINSICKEIEEHIKLIKSLDFFQKSGNVISEFQTQTPTYKR